MTGAAGVRVLAALAALALLAGCTVEERAEDEGDRDGARTSPFTGEPVDERGPVLAVKVDNAPPARPHTGLDAADIVYVEEVEAGLSRLVAVYSGQLPDLVGPVRSARESDLELLRQFGEPALAYSGAQSRLQPLIAEAPLAARSHGDTPDAYRRDENRAAPHNLFVNPEELLASAPEASEAGDIGFVFGDPPEDGGEPTEEEQVSYPGAEFGFRWEAGAERWAVTMDGAETDLGAATVVLQEVTVRPSEFQDSSGSVTPYTETVGSGAATVLRDGQAYQADWRRPGERQGTEFTTPDGEPMRFAAGQVWVVFVPS